MKILTLADLGPTKDPTDSVAYDGEGVIELTRRARIREREITELETQLAAAEVRERGLREALEAWQRFADHCHEHNITVPLWAYKLSELAIDKTQAALVQPSNAARTDGERTARPALPGVLKPPFIVRQAQFPDPHFSNISTKDGTLIAEVPRQFEDWVCAVLNNAAMEGDHATD